MKLLAILSCLLLKVKNNKGLTSSGIYHGIKVEMVLAGIREE